MKTFRIAKVLFKSMFKKPATLMYPVVQREWQERTRGSIDIEVDKCIACGICAKRCPADAIEVDRGPGKWTIHRMQCIQCGECVQACPKKCLAMNNQYTEPQAEKVVDTFTIPAKESKGSAGGDLSCNKDECVYCGLCAKACPADALKVDRKEKIWEVDKELCAKCGACVDKCPKKCLSMGDAAEKAADAPSKGIQDAAAADSAKDAEKSGEEPEKDDAPAAKAVVDPEKCIYCGVRANECPSEAINAEMDNWTLDEDKCTGCGVCADACPADAIKVE